MGPKHNLVHFKSLWGCLLIKSWSSSQLIIRLFRFAYQQVSDTFIHAIKHYGIEATKGCKKHIVVEKATLFGKYYGFFAKYVVDSELVTLKPSGKGRDFKRLTADDAVKLLSNS